MDALDSIMAQNGQGYLQVIGEGKAHYKEAQRANYWELRASEIELSSGNPRSECWSLFVDGQFRGLNREVAVLKPRVLREMEKGLPVLLAKWGKGKNIVIPADPSTVQ